MELKCFLLLIAFLMAFLVLLIALFKGEEGKWTNSPVPYFGILALAMFLSYLTFVRYAKSDGKDNYYKNTDYYLFQEEGFRFPKGGIAKLGCNEPDSAILISGAGKLTLDDSLCLSSEQFELPLYVGTAGENATINMKVVNLIKEYAMGDGDSLTIEKVGKDGRYSSRVLSIKYIEFPHERKFVERFKGSSEIPDYDSVMFVFSANGLPNDTVIKKSFHKGYNLADLLQEGQSTRFNGNALSFYRSCYLVRDHYALDAPKVKKSDKVYLFADNPVFNDSCRVVVNGTVINSRVENRVINLKMNNGYFCYGIGGATSRVYQVIDEDNAVLVKYRLPLMYNLPNDAIGEARLFLTTSKQDIVELSDDYNAASFDAGKDYIFYQFNEQLSDSSVYRASAVLNFRIDKAGVSMDPFYSNSYGKNAQTLNEIIPNQSFEVKTLSCEQDTDLAKVSYVFNIKDMRRNEVYNGAKRMYVFMLVLLLIIYLILHYMPKMNADLMNKWYGIETSIYLVLVAFLTVRLVLLWRLHTFPPIEDVSYKEFETLTDASYYKWTNVSIIIILALRIGALLYQWIQYSRGGRWMDLRLSYRVNRWLKKAQQSLWKRLLWFFIPALIYLVCGFILGRSRTAEVFIKEALAPIIVFVINSIYYAYKVRVESNGSEDDPDVKHAKRFCWVAILINSVSYLVFLLMPKSWGCGFGEQGMVAPMAAMLVLWICIAAFLSEEKIIKWIYLLIAVVGFIVVFLHAGIIEKHEWGKALVEAFPKSRITARMETLVYSPTDMVQREGVEFGGETLQDILNASSNKWFIDDHLIQRKKLDARDGVFLLCKEYNQLAVSYTTQTRDVVLLRYIIFEHGKGIVVRLLFILALMAVIVLTLYKRNGDELPLLQMVPLQSALFLLVFASFLYLVNLNAVVFVGLDFPFLSMASKVAPFGLLLPLLAMLLPLNIDNTDQVLEEELALSNSSDRNNKKKFIVMGCSALFVFAFVWIPSKGSDSKMNQKKEEGRLYSETFSVSMEPLAVFINNYMNPEFKTRQQNEKKYQSFKRTSIHAEVLKAKLDSALIVDGLLGQQLKAYAREKEKNSRDTAFIRSAFEKFLKTTLTDTKSLIHVRKTKGYFVFATNKKYYDMNSKFNNGKEAEWRGNLLAAATFRSLRFKDERPSTHNKNLSWNIDTVSQLKILSSDSKYRQFLMDNDSTLSCYLFQIPAKYCYKSKDDVFVVMRDVQNKQNKQNRPLIKVYPQRDYSPDNTVKSSLGLRFFANDIVEPDGIDSRFSIRLDDDHYFSKRIHYNGKHQVIYPLKNSFMFAYNFDQMLAESYHPDSSLSEQPVRISLDYDLFESVYNYCDKVIGHDMGYGDGIAVTAIDGNGRIRLLADYNPNRILTTDPNQERELREKMEEIYLNGDNPADLAFLQNRNVAYMSMGPGSTIKVPFYVALMSETQDIQWDTLRVQFPEGMWKDVRNEKGKVREVVAQFGRDVVGGLHSLGGWDEMEYEYSNPSKFGYLGPSDFIATSNNFYFAALLMLGAYDAQELNRGLGTVLDYSRQEVREFPKFLLDGNYYAFKKNLMQDIQGDQNRNRSSHALEAGLSNRFRFNLSHGNSLLHYYDREPVRSLFDATLDSEWANMNGMYVHSTRPSLYRDISGQTNQETFYDNHFQLTSGSPLQMEVTPLNMAEMYLRIALMNWSEENLLTYDDAAKGVPLAKESSGEGFARLMQETAFKGMYKVIEQTKPGLRGTLSKRSDKDERVGEEIKRELKREGIFLYGKTGTAGGDGQVNNNHHYAFVLTNKPLHKDNVDREGLKVYVVYFGYYNDTQGHPGTQPSRDVILHQIINSETFKNYWNSNESSN